MRFGNARLSVESMGYSSLKCVFILVLTFTIRNVEAEHVKCKNFNSSIYNDEHFLLSTTFSNKDIKLRRQVRPTKNKTDSQEFAK